MNNARTAAAGTSKEKPPVLGRVLPTGIVSRITLSLFGMLSLVVADPVVLAPVVSPVVAPGVVPVDAPVVSPVVAPVVSAVVAPVMSPVIVPVVSVVVGVPPSVHSSTFIVYSVSVATAIM